MHLRHDCTQEFLDDLRDISQSTVSRIATTLIPNIKSVLEEFVPTAQEAIGMVNGRVCLWWTAPSLHAGHTPSIASYGAASTARSGSTYN